MLRDQDDTDTDGNAALEERSDFVLGLLIDDVETVESSFNSNC